MFSIENKELTNIEQKLKQFHLRYPSRHFDQPCTLNEVRDVLNNSYQEQMIDISFDLEAIIRENNFIHDDLDVAFVRHFRYTPAFWHEHNFFELLYVADGSCTNTMFNHSISMKTGDICFIVPGAIHAISAFSDEDVILNILIRKSTFETSFLGLLNGDNILSDFFRRTFYQTEEIPYLYVPTGNDTQLRQQFNTAYEEYNSEHRYKKQMLNALLSEFLIALLRNHEQDISVSHVHLNKNDENLMYIMYYMQKRYATVTLKEMAEFFNYSERQLQRIISNATGMTFKENIQKQKMAKSADLLLNSSLPIGKICEETGFESQNNFRKIFQRYYGMTPSEFRKKATQSPS